MENSAKQKAVEIYQKMYLVRSNSASDITKHFAKQCALIAVDEAIKAVDYVCTNDKIWWINYDFWQQVRSEIEKL